MSGCSAKFSSSTSTGDFGGTDGSYFKDQSLAIRHTGIAFLGTIAGLKLKGSFEKHASSCQKRKAIKNLLKLKEPQEVKKENEVN